MPAGVRAALEPELRPISFGHGHLFHAPDTLIDEMHFPVDGVVSVLTELADGSAVETATIGREGVVGFASAFLPIRAHGRTIGQAPGAAFAVPSALVRSLAAESAPLRALVVGYGELVLAQSQQSAACNISHDVEERFSRWLLTCDDRVRGGRVDLTQEFLAMMLGVQRTTVSQVASTLQAAGLIRYNRGRIDILDRAGLEQRSCECYAAIRRRMRRFLPAEADGLTPTHADAHAGLG